MSMSCHSEHRPVILNEVKNLGTGMQILRCAQDDNWKRFRMTTKMVQDDNQEWFRMN